MAPGRSEATRRAFRASVTGLRPATTSPLRMARADRAGRKKAAVAQQPSPARRHCASPRPPSPIHPRSVASPPTRWPRSRHPRRTRGCRRDSTRVRRWRSRESWIRLARARCRPQASQRGERATGGGVCAHQQASTGRLTRGKTAPVLRRHQPAPQVQRVQRLRVVVGVHRHDERTVRVDAVRHRRTHHGRLGAIQRELAEGRWAVVGCTDGGHAPIRALQAGQRTQHRGLAAARRADERGDLLLRDVEVDVAQRVELAVVEVQVAHGQLGAHAIGSEGCIHGVQIRTRVSTRARMFRPSTARVMMKTPAQASCCQFS